MDYTAHEIASLPELYNRIVLIGKHEYECMGYTRTGNTIRFSREIVGHTALDENGKWNIRVITKYLQPDSIVTIVDK